MKKKIALLASVIMLIAAAPVWAASDDGGQSQPGSGCYVDDNGREVCPGPGAQSQEQSQSQNQGWGCRHHQKGNGNGVCWRR